MMLVLDTPVPHAGDDAAEERATRSVPLALRRMGFAPRPERGAKLSGDADGSWFATAAPGLAPSRRTLPARNDPTPDWRPL